MPVCAAVRIVEPAASPIQGQGLSAHDDGGGLAMFEGVFFKAVGPIGDTDTNALPVKETGPAIGYYIQCLGFSLVSKDRTTAVLSRDDVRIGLAVNGRDPEQASCWFSVGDVDALWRELDAKGIEPGIIDEQEYDGTPYRAFFAKDPYGVCFCFTQPLEPKGGD